MAAEADLEKEVVVHQHGYHRFLTLMKWGAGISLVLALIVIFVISN